MRPHATLRNLGSPYPGEHANTQCATVIGRATPTGHWAPGMEGPVAPWDHDPREHNERRYPPFRSGSLNRRGNLVNSG